MSNASERRIIVGIDDSPPGLAALHWAVGQARSSQAQLVAVRSWALGLPRHGGRHHRHLPHPRVVLLFNGAEDATHAGDLIVVGHRNGPGWRYPRRGSVSRYCRSYAGCPVVVVPTDQESS